MPRRHYLTKKQLQELEGILRQRLAELTGKEQEMFSALTNEEAKDHPDEIDQASHESERLLDLRIHDREKKVIPKITKALEKMKEGEYGYCESCGVEIGYERLKARPVAEFCIDCKNEFEARERRERDFSRVTGLN